MHITPVYDNISRNSLIPRDETWEWDSGEPGSVTRGEPGSVTPESLGVGLRRAWECDSGEPGSVTLESLGV